ncbi:hypothetical protein CL620_03325 [archaeon]|nr:hypothetical protein [archaeon]
MLYDVFPLNREEARTKYIENGLSAEQAAVMIETTHCTNLLPNYYITSQDMIGKAGVWGHFGSWDFERATMFQNVNGVPRQQGVTYLQNTFGMSEADANAQYTEIQTANADRWIAPWPGYLGGQRSCQRLSETEHRCIGNVNNQQLSMIVDTELLDIRIEGNDNVKPNSLVYPTATDVLEKKLDGETVGFSLALIPNGANFDFIIADPLQVASTFTKLYFYNGHGMKCFEAFDDVRQVSGGRILTWKVDYQCMQSGSVLLERAN